MLLLTRYSLLMLFILGPHSGFGQVPSTAQRLHAALDKAGVPNQLVSIPGAGHDGFNRQALMSSYAAVREFLRKYGILTKE